MAIRTLIALLAFLALYSTTYLALVRPPAQWQLNRFQKVSVSERGITFTDSQRGTKVVTGDIRYFPRYPVGQDFFRIVFAPIHEIDYRIRRDTWRPWIRVADNQRAITNRRFELTGQPSGDSTVSE